MATKTLTNQQPAKQIHLKPVIKIPPAQVTVQPNSDLRGLTQEMAKISAYITELARIQQEAIQLQTQILQALQNQKEPKITVQTPTKDRTGERDFYVELDKEDGETVGMRITSVATD